MKMKYYFIFVDVQTREDKQNNIKQILKYFLSLSSVKRNRFLYKNVTVKLMF